MSLAHRLKRVKIIAEIGVNHNGNISIAKRLIKIAKDSGADYVKFQIYDPNEIVTAYATKAKYQSKNLCKKSSQKEMLKKYYFNIKQLTLIYNYCDKINIKFLASIFDCKSLELIKKFKVDFLKIPSSEITNYILLRKVKRFKKAKLIFSTGMSSQNDILKFHNFFKNTKILLIPLYCVSSYPTKVNEIDLKKLRLIKKKFKFFGFSDHTETDEASIISVYEGAKIIEKHLTFNNNAKGPDHKASLNPKNFKKFVRSVRNTEIIISSKKKVNIEMQNLKFVRKFLVAKSNIEKGDRFSIKNLAAKRVGKIGICPSLIQSILGKKATMKFEKDELIKI